MKRNTFTLNSPIHLLLGEITKILSHIVTTSSNTDRWNFDIKLTCSKHSFKDHQTSFKRSSISSSSLSSPAVMLWLTTAWLCSWKSSSSLGPFPRSWSWWSVPEEEWWVSMELQSARESWGLRFIRPIIFSASSVISIPPGKKTTSHKRTNRCGPLSKLTHGHPGFDQLWIKSVWLDPIEWVRLIDLCLRPEFCSGSGRLPAHVPATVTGTTSRCRTSWFLGH